MSALESGPEVPSPAALFAHVAAGVAAGLPVPITVEVFRHGSLVVRLDDEDEAGVGRWCAYLRLGAPTLRPGVVEAIGQQRWQAYGTGRHGGELLQGWLGWSASVWCSVPAEDEPAGTEPGGAAS